MMFSILVALLLLAVFPPSDAEEEFPPVEHCSTEQGGGICPVENTCCLLEGGRSGCIPSDLGARNATCCSDKKTGCGVGYVCAQNHQCVATAAIPDPLVQALPRYSLCQAGKYSDFGQIFGLSLPNTTKKLLYYSSHGALEEALQQNDAIQMVLIVLHGANRNADDYFCAATAAVKLQKYWPIDQILVVAPRFVVANDLPTHLLDSTLTWADVSDGSWRYGSNAWNSKVSSFDAMDALVEKLVQSLPRHRLVLVGHSSGGQFVQRWALLSAQAGRVRSVVANPSSYAYLIPERYNGSDWIQPNKTKCPRYNRWEWGLETSTEETPDYVQRVLSEFYNASNVQQQPYQRLIQRFAQRSVVYLTGSLDRCNVSRSTHAWCNSHGLETTCSDELQGVNRWERAQRYWAMLQQVAGVTIKPNCHKQVVVPGVGHDHSLMMTSPQGLDVLFQLEVIQPAVG